ncbi:MAG: cytochrome c [Williamsia sp.]|nr:cytochrome c [Williamsia sp.]
MSKIRKQFTVFCCWCALTLLCGSCRENKNRSGDGVAALSGTATSGWPARFGWGKPATDAEISALDIDVRPDGKGLPAGVGNAVEGKTVYLQKCAACHGLSGREGPQAQLVGSVDDTTKAKTIGNYWPYATTVFDYIRRTMPYNTPGSLTNEEVYNLTAFLLSANKIIDSTTRLDAATLPGVHMPAQKNFVPDDRHGGPEIR